MSICYKDYPKDWKKRRTRILFRAGERRNHQGEIIAQAACELCDAPNREFIFRRRDDRLKWRYPTGNDLGEADPDYRGTAIVLTTAHLDRTGPPGPEDGPLDCPDERLMALCQSCHLHLDRHRHQAKAAATRQAKQQPLPLLAA